MNSGEGPLWTPSPQRVAAAEITRFSAQAEARAGHGLASYDDLHRWSVTDPASFWDLVWDHCAIIGDKGATVLTGATDMLGAQFFPEATLNFAENVLRRTGTDPALIFRGEAGDARALSWDDLHALVSRLQQAYRDLGIEPGDRIAAMLPNVPEAVAAMLAAASIGAVWCSCSPDFGAQGVIDRFGQIEPKLLLVADGYVYAGKWHGTSAKLERISAALAPVHTVLLPYAEPPRTPAAGTTSLASFVEPFSPRPLTFVPTAFAHPLLILFTSGTTGQPKCIVHSAGGTLLQHVKEHRLHCDIRREDRVFYFTTLGWMMWNWQVTALASGATLCLFDGSPGHPDLSVLFDYARDAGFTFFGTSAKFIDTLRNAGLRPRVTHKLDRLRTIASTGSPLSADGFRYVYDHVCSDVHLASISGGTDIVSCFVLGVPTLPVWSGEIQASGLGMAIDVFDDEGAPLARGKGELVCTRPFPSMPLGFWNDADRALYAAAYFERFLGIWCHGDFAERTEHGGMVIHGRSDATLNPGGVRIGTAEIYAHAEQLPEVEEAVCVGKEVEGDVSVILFVQLAVGVALDADLITRLKSTIRAAASPRHVPDEVFAVPDIPRTRSGKISELAVRDAINGREPGNISALTNPESLAFYRKIGEREWPNGVKA